MHPHGPRRRGGTALLAACVIAGLTASLVGYSASNSANAPTAERAVTSSTAAGVDSKLLGPLPVAYVAYGPEIPPEPPVPPRPEPPLGIDRGRIPAVPRPLPPREPVPTVQDRENALIAPLREDNLDREMIRKIIEIACGAYDAYNILQAESLDDAINRAIVSRGGVVMRPARVVETFNGVYEARSSTDQALQMAASGICEGNAVLPYRR
jgi:hypothetical protein